MNTNEIRRAFLTYFETHGHQAVMSSSLVPENDATLLFTNAGMVQFKEAFLGIESLPYTCAVSVQRCVRAGGKHNDLDNVGYTARHHTFFEMLGNFSFGDYFKRQAIQYAWQFLTEVLHIPKERLWVTVYVNDDEAATIWLNDIGVSPQRLSRCGDDDNFWSMGDTGPCGPCTEIFYDHGDSIPGGPPGSADADGDRYVELWNLVFMQFNRDKAGVLHPLPKPSVDTGMGLERVAAVLQGVHTNYETDVFVQLIQAILALCPDSERVNQDNPSLRVIADHLRASAFLIADGVLPSHDGRGYVLRRIIRRAVRHGYQLGLPLPFFTLLVKPLMQIMGDAYPVLITQQIAIEQALEKEERQFARTLEQGLSLLNAAFLDLNADKIPGSVAFKLYDTYGFPVDLTADIARERGVSVDFVGFEACMQRQRQLSQSASTFRAHDPDVSLVTEQVSTFTGYTQNTAAGVIQVLLSKGQPVEQLTVGAPAVIVLDVTPFYAESGGQVGDRGAIYPLSGDGLFRVNDTERRGQVILHHGELERGEFRVGQAVCAEIDSVRRDAIRLNHTATHLLHAALQTIMGLHVQQKGSLVDAERARFDFSHAEALSTAQIESIEQLVNRIIRHNEFIDTSVMSIERARESGAIGLFGEKYADQVRVLSIGDFSKELCGGTHATRTGDLGLFKIVAEYGVASGVRRIELVTGQYALDWMNQQLHSLDNIALQLKTTVAEAPEKLAQWVLHAKQQERRIQTLQAELNLQLMPALLAEVEQVNGIQVLIKSFDTMEMRDLRVIFDGLRARLEKAVLILIAVQSDKMQVIAGVSQLLVSPELSAAKLVRTLCGKGGGRDDMAQGGGSLPNDLALQVSRIRLMIEQATHP